MSELQVHSRFPSIADREVGEWSDRFRGAPLLTEVGVMGANWPKPEQPFSVRNGNKQTFVAGIASGWSRPKADGQTPGKGYHGTIKSGVRSDPAHPVERGEAPGQIDDVTPVRGLSDEVPHRDVRHILPQL